MTTGKVVLFLLLLAFVGTATADTLYVNTTGWYRSGAAFNASATPIQHAVDNATSGDTVYVWNGSYTENVDIATTHLTIEGEGSDVVTVTGASSDDYVFDVTANYVNISGVNVTGATVLGRAGIELDGVNNCIISQTAGSNNDNCILLYHASSNTLTDNIASNNEVGIMIVQSSSSNVLTNNTLDSNDDWGIAVFTSSINNTLTNNTALNSIRGIFINTDSNTLTNNTVSNCDTGINLCSADHNIFTDTTANSNNDYGIWLDGSSNNNIFTDTTANSNSIYGIWIRWSINNIFTNSVASNNTKYDYFVWASSRNNTLLDCNLDNSTSMMNDSTSQWIIKYTTSNITKYSDTTINQTISPTNVSTTIEPTVDDYAVTMDTLDDFSASTDVSTATLQLAEFASGGHSEFTVSSDTPTTVATFNLGTFPVGQAVQLNQNDLGVTCARAGAAGIATFIYSGGFSDHEFETDPVGLYVHLNDTENYTFTNDSYDAAAFTSQVTITSTGSPTCAVSIEMPLITDPAYTKLGYTVTNVTGGYRVTNSSGWAAINFTVTDTTIVEISPAAAAKPSNLPAVVAGGIGVVTVVIYLIRRRRR